MRRRQDVRAPYGAQASSLHYGPRTSSPPGGYDARAPSTPFAMKHLLYIALFVLFLLHNDLWLWNDECLVAGIPSGLLYHILYCVASSVLMIGLVKFAWPGHLEVESGDEE